MRMSLEPPVFYAVASRAKPLDHQRQRVVLVMPMGSSDGAAARACVRALYVAATDRGVQYGPGRYSFGPRSLARGLALTIAKLLGV